MASRRRKVQFDGDGGAMDLAFLVMLSLMMLLSQRMAQLGGVPLLVRNLPVQSHEALKPTANPLGAFHVSIASPLRADMPYTISFAGPNGQKFPGTLELHLADEEKTKKVQLPEGRDLFVGPLVDALTEHREDRNWKGGDVVLEVAADVPFAFVNLSLIALEEVAVEKDITDLLVSYRLVSVR